MFHKALPILAASTAMVLCAGVAHAVTIPGGFSSVVIFGDSLSDTGNTADAIAAATGGTVTFPPPPYNPGRFTGGDTYVDILTSDWHLTPGVTQFNFAFGSAKATTDITDTVPDFGEQIALFAGTFAGDFTPLGPEPLVIVNFGGNDAIGAAAAAGGIATLGFSGVAGDETTPLQVASGLAVAETIGAAAADSVQSGIEGLATLGFENFLLYDLVDPGQTPRFLEPNLNGTNPDSGNSTGQYATAAANAFNAALGLNAASLRALGLDIFEVGASARFTEILADPTAFGLSDATSACGTLAGLNVLGLSIYDFSDDTCDENDIAAITAPFWDDVHPNQQLHAEYAALATAAIAPIPVPAPLALLAGGLLALRSLRSLRRRG